MGSNNGLNEHSDFYYKVYDFINKNRTPEVFGFIILWGLLIFLLTRDPEFPSALEIIGGLVIFFIGAGFCIEAEEKVPLIFRVIAFGVGFIFMIVFVLGIFYSIYIVIERAFL